MPVVKIECETSAKSYQLSIFKRDSTLVATCPVNHAYNGNLLNGQYIVAWKIFGKEHEKYKITFEGVASPKKSTERKILKGEIASFNSRSFTVGV